MANYRKNFSTFYHFFKKNVFCAYETSFIKFACGKVLKKCGKLEKNIPKKSIFHILVQKSGRRLISIKSISFSVNSTKFLAFFILKIVDFLIHKKCGKLNKT